VLSKLLLFALLGLVVVKFVLRLTFRELARRLDLAVNVMLALIALLYVVHLVWWATG